MAEPISPGDGGVGVCGLAGAPLATSRPALSYKWMPSRYSRARLFSPKLASELAGGALAPLPAEPRSACSMTFSTAWATLNVCAEKAIDRLRRLVFAWRSVSS